MSGASMVFTRRIPLTDASLKNIDVRVKGACFIPGHFSRFFTLHAAEAGALPMASRVLKSKVHFDCGANNRI